MGLFSRTPEVTATEAAERQAAGALVVDVREDEEWAAGRIPDAVHMPLGTVPSRMGELPTDRPIIVACRSGARSARATKLLADAGFDAVNLAGGTQAWHGAGQPLDPRDGHVA